MSIKNLTLILAMLFGMVITSCGDKEGDEATTTDTDTAAVVTPAEEPELEYSLDDIDLSDTTIVDTTGAANKTLKIGYVNSQEILVNLSDIKRADKELETFAKNLEAQIQKEQQNMQRKYAQYMADTTATESINRMRTEELQGMQQRLMQLQYSSEQELARKREQLYAPILDKVNAVIKRVAQQQGYTHILDAAAVLYIDDAYNVTPVVKRALGIR